MGFNSGFKGLMSVLQVTKALQNGNGCNLCNVWSEHLTPLLACTFEHKGNKTGAPDCSSTMINYNLCNPSQDQSNKPANVLQRFFKFYFKRRMILWDKETEGCMFLLLRFTTCDTETSRTFSSRLPITQIRQNQKLYVNNSRGI